MGINTEDFLTFNSYSNEFESKLEGPQKIPSTDLLPKIKNSIREAAFKDRASTEINPKIREIIKGACSIFSSVCMAPLDRIIAVKMIGKKITREHLCEIAKKPFLGAGPRQLSQSLGALFTFGGAAALHTPLQHQLPQYPTTVSALSLAGGTLLDRIMTSPLTTVGFRMQTQGRNFGEIFREALKTGRPWRTLYAGTPALMMRDLCYLPVCIPMAETMNRFFSPKQEPTLFMTTLSFIASGSIASILSYPWQYIGLMQKDSLEQLSVRKLFCKTLHERGPSGFYRGFGATLGRMSIFNLLFGGSIALIERLVKTLKQD
jgi:hypothetical protein